MERPSIDLKAISCRGVRSLVPFQKPALYATVSVSSDPGNLPFRHQTPVNRDGGQNPEWDHPIRLYFLRGSAPDPALLRFDIKAKAPLLGDRLVGAVRVPVADLASQGPAGALRHASYQVLAPDGKPNGVLRFSYVLNHADVQPPPPPPPAFPPTVENLMAYPQPPQPRSSAGYPSPPDRGPNYAPPSPDQKIHYPTVELEPVAVYAPLTDPHRTAIHAPLDVIYPAPAPAPAPAFGYYLAAPEPVLAYPVQAPAMGGYYPPPAPGWNARGWYG